MTSLLEYVTTDQIRHLRPGEHLDLWDDQMVLPSPDPEWIWVSVQDGQTAGVLVGAPCHGIAMMLRLVNFTNDNSIVYKLLREAAREVKSKGYVAFMVIADPKRPSEAAMLRVVEQVGGVLDSGYTLAGGPIPESF